MGEEQPREEQREEQRPLPLVRSLTYGTGTFLAAGKVDLLAHLGPTGLVVGGIAAYVAAQHGPELVERVREAFPPRADGQPTEEVDQQGEEKKQQHGGRRLIDRALGRFPEEKASPPPEGTAQDAAAPALLDDEEGARQPAEDAAFARAAAQKEVPGVPRLTVDQIVRHIEPNSYKLYIGRSLTRPGYPAVQISFYKRHLKLIGASQYGKSSMAAALLEIITRTHDPQHVLVALLDLEDQASRLFAALPHRAQVTISGRQVVLHAHTPEQVLEYLGYVIQVMDYRYTLSETQLLHEPLLLVYLEEFITLKDYFKSRIDTVRRDDREQAKQDYADLVFSIKELARRGLKARVQLLLCAQCDYRDEDLQEALINVTAGMSFCVRVTAAQAAGFYQTDLLARNAKEDKRGQAVVEMPDCKDLVLAPDYDLEQRLIALEQAALAEGMRQGKSAGGIAQRYQWQSLPSSQPTAGIPSTFASQAVQVTPLPVQPPRPRRPVDTAGRHPGVLPSDLRVALDAYRPGMSYRDLGKALRYDDAAARMLWLELRQRGLLHVSEKRRPAEQASSPAAPQNKPVAEESDLDRALRAYDQGNTTINALALALNMSPWNVRPLYTQVKKLREHAG